tara:strand:- start:130 stop:357 length:228 start_codon:yes stop_codon:yes gene_type:complete
MTIENLKLAVRAMGSVINDLTNELDALQDKYDDLKRDERRYAEWWNEETKETDRLKAILEKSGMASEPVEADESN